MKTELLGFLICAGLGVLMYCTDKTIRRIRNENRI